MEIIYITTHLLMAVSITSILYLFLEPFYKIDHQRNSKHATWFYNLNLKLPEVIIMILFGISAIIVPVF
jgi:hypothetical protein